MILNSGRNDEASLTRREIFAANRERVFTAWTDADVLKKWWGPPGCITRSVEIDLQVGDAIALRCSFPKRMFFIFTVSIA